MLLIVRVSAFGLLFQNEFSYRFIVLPFYSFPLCSFLSFLHSPVISFFFPCFLNSFPSFLLFFSSFPPTFLSIPFRIPMDSLPRHLFFSAIQGKFINISVQLSFVFHHLAGFLLHSALQENPLVFIESLVLTLLFFVPSLATGTSFS